MIYNINNVNKNNKYALKYICKWMMKIVNNDA